MTNTEPTVSLTCTQMTTLAHMAADLFQAAAAELNQIGEQCTSGPAIADQLRAFTRNQGRSVERILAMAASVGLADAAPEAEAAE